MDQTDEKEESTKVTDPDKNNNLQMLLPAIGGCLAVIGVIICIIALKKNKKEDNKEEKEAE